MDDSEGKDKVVVEEAGTSLLRKKLREVSRGLPMAVMSEWRLEKGRRWTRDVCGGK